MARLVSNMSTKESLMKYRRMMVAGLFLVSFLALSASAVEGEAKLAEDEPPREMKVMRLLVD